MMGTKVANLNATVGKGFMQLFVTQEGQTWDITPYVAAVFENGALVVFSKENRDITYGVEKAAPGDLFHVQVFGHEKKPLLKKGDNVIEIFESDKVTEPYVTFTDKPEL